MNPSVHATGDEKKKAESGELIEARVTITATSVKDLRAFIGGMDEKIKKVKEGNDNFVVHGPTPMPRRRLRVTTRRAPNGNGTETFDHFELRVHKRVYYFKVTKEALKTILNVSVIQQVHVDVKIKASEAAGR